MDSASNRRFPLLEGGTVAWEMGAKAFETYTQLHGQPLGEIVRRGGFSLEELGCYLLGHHPPCGRLTPTKLAR